MSRAAASAGPLTRANHIFETEVTDRNQKKSRVISSEALGDSSIRVNRTWDGERWEGTVYVKTKCTNAGALFLLITLCSRDDIRHKKNTPHEALNFVEWWHILQFLFHPESFHQIAQYATAIRRPFLFPRIDARWQEPFLIVDAAMRGQEDMVLNVLRADPSYLLQKANVKNSMGVEYEVTPLQAAIMANDVQLVERMREHFVRLTTDSFDGIAEMHRQIKAIYKISLQNYFELQQNKIATLQSSQSIDRSLIDQAQRQCDLYQAALQSDDMNKIFEAHNVAEENNAFDFQPYVDAILNAPQVELDDAMALINAQTKAETDAVISRTGVAAREAADCGAKPFDQLTLVQKLNRFREKLVEHMQHDIIFNPNHILVGLKANDAVWDSLPHAQDQNYHKRSVIFSQLCGWAQRNAAEPVKQDIRQGTSYLTEENEPRSRQSRFNDLDRSYNDVVRNSLGDVSLIDSSSVGGFGYKFAAFRGRCHLASLSCCVCCAPYAALAALKTYVEQKQQAFRTYYAERAVVSLPNCAK